MWQGLTYAVSALLQSPYFLFRVEHGEPDPTRPDGYRYTSLEMASRLSYFLWQTTPDEELLTAGERGELVTREGLEAQARRMLASDRAQRTFLAFFRELFDLGELEMLDKDPALFPEVTSTLGPAMRTEVELMITHTALDASADFRTLLDTRTTYVNDELARLYGVDAAGATAADFVPVTLPEASMRGGIMGTAGMLAHLAHRDLTSPTRRGKFVRTGLLCEDIPPPPPGVVTTVPAAMPGQTMRQRLERHRTEPLCAGCHVRMDPLGLGLENFDAIGAFRTMDGDALIDAHSDVDGVPFEGARELGQVLRANPGVAACFARQLYRFGSGRVETGDREPEFEAITTRVTASGSHFWDLVLEVALSDDFRFPAPPEDGGVSP